MSDRRERRSEQRKREWEQAQDEVAVDPGMSDSEIEARIRKRVQRWINKRNEFMGHLIAYITGNALVWSIWAFSGGHGDGLPWPLWVTFVWGIGLVAHALDTWQHSPAFQARSEMTIQREVEREKMRMGINTGRSYEKPKRSLSMDQDNDPISTGDRPMRLTDDGELIPAEDDVDQKPVMRKAQRDE